MRTSLPTCVPWLLPALVLGNLTAHPAAPASPAPISAEGSQTTLETRLRATVSHLATTIGERNLERPHRLQASAAWIATQFRTHGLSPTLHEYTVGGATCANVIADVAGPSSAPVLLIGAHYDSAPGTPGADDNATGVAVLLEVSRALAQARVRCRLRCAAFVNEEPPYFASDQMGSRVYAARAAAHHDPIALMLCLESLGYFSDTSGSQLYPPLLSYVYPDTGNFLAVVGSLSQATTVRVVTSYLRGFSSVPVQSVALPPDVTGVSWSDHASFWTHGYQAVMLTDTAPLRNPNYHSRTDTPDTLDFRRLAVITEAVIKSVHSMALRRSPLE